MSVTMLQLKKIGPPEKVINAFGPEMIGKNVEGKVLSANVTEHEGRTYDQFELEPPHIFITATAAGNCLYLFGVTGNDMAIYPLLSSFTTSSLNNYKVYKEAIRTNRKESNVVLIAGLQWKRHYDDLKKKLNLFELYN